MGLDRIIMTMEQEGCPFPGEVPCDIYIGSMGENENIKSLQLACELRSEGFVVELDTVGRSVKAQMKYADKINAAYSCIIGSNELEAGSVRIKNMDSGENSETKLSAEAFRDFLYNEYAARIEAPLV